MKKISIIWLFLLFTFPFFGQLKSYSFSEVEKLNKITPKPTLVFVHTSWCNYCKIMENSTFKNQEVIQQLNENFYFVSLDAEVPSDITFLNHTFKFRPTGPKTGVHELATELATINNKVMYPTIAILDASFAILFQKQSYLNAEELLSILQKIK
ncbi:thioredoxin family protein [Flavobacterium amnicola]|uniref:Thioredoxin family protein n=1 Tax=Flavobacterium amnicola TaxID=2506422 RepID=A0A4Q1K6J7_9FLAO|nr:thioredoxin family protein [Flavobacterium amnicola]RXR21160.1 thioredoxin family protein [Flavobacterium amnicola]